jgi:hypothetical protein
MLVDPEFRLGVGEICMLVGMKTGVPCISLGVPCIGGSGGCHAGVLQSPEGERPSARKVPPFGPSDH